MAKRKPDPAEMPDEENPEWTDETFARALPAAEVLPRYIGQAATDELLRRGPGRPAKADRKVNQTLRLDADVLEAYLNSVAETSRMRPSNSPNFTYFTHFCKPRVRG